MTTPDNGKTPEKKPFWNKLLERISKKDDTTSDTNSTLESIISSVEKKAKQPLVENIADHGIAVTQEAKGMKKPGATAEQDPHELLKKAHLAFGATLIISFSIWLTFFVIIFDEENRILAKFNSYNIPATLAIKEELNTRLTTDLKDTREFIALIKLENIATLVSSLDLDDPVLNYTAPSGGTVIPRGNETNSTEPQYRIISESGEIVYVPESEVNALKSVQADRMSYAKTLLRQISLQMQDMQEEKNLSKKMRDQAERMQTHLALIDFEEVKFPSALTKTDMRAARAEARSILIEVKEKNLKNLVADLKKQVRTIDAHNTDMTTQELVTRLTGILDVLSVKKPSTFEMALSQVSTLNIGNVNDPDVYRKIVQIIGDNDAQEGDLAAAATIAHNLAKETIINELSAQRITWSPIIETIEKIARLGADMTPDEGNAPLDARRDIDPSNTLVAFTGFSGKADKNTIEVKGQVVGEGSYDNQNFTLLADLVDAFEGSSSFQDIEGSSYSKNKDLAGKFFSPMNFKLMIQQPNIADERDIKIIVEEEEEIELPDFEAIQTTTEAETAAEAASATVAKPIKTSDMEVAVGEMQETVIEEPSDVTPVEEMAKATESIVTEEAIEVTPATKETTAESMTDADTSELDALLNN